MAGERELLRRGIDRVLRDGASYADARWIPEEVHQSLLLQDGNLKENSLTRMSGLGVRVLAGGAWGFSAGSDPASWPAVFERAHANAKAASARVREPVTLAPRRPVQGRYGSPCRIDPFGVGLDEKVAFLKDLDPLLDRPGVEQRYALVTCLRKEIVYLDSEDAAVDKRVTEVFGRLGVSGRDGEGVTQQRSWRLGGGDGRGTRGWESFRPELFRDQAARITEELAALRAAPACPRDVRSVILLPGIMYLQVHETIGHALELDRILGYELSYAGGSFVRLEDFGSLRYGSDRLTVRADGTLANSPGSFGFDDEGVPCQDTLLIDRGLLVGAITGRQMVEEANRKAGRRVFTGSGGCSRATAFWRVPLERMTNINVDPGNDGDLEDLVRGTEHGIILDGDRSWSIGSNREQFHFACETGVLVKDGRRAGLVKNATYGGPTLPFWRNLSAVGDASTWTLEHVANCGKGLPNQIMQLGHAVPVCRFDHVQVGC